MPGMSSKINRNNRFIPKRDVFNVLAALILMIGCQGWLFSQTNLKSEIIEEEQGIGPNQYGASGLFVTPSAALIGVGQISASVFHNGEYGRSKTLKSFPLAVGFGASKRVEMYGSFLSWDHQDGQYSQYSTLGFKMFLHRFETTKAIPLSGEFRLQRIERQNTIEGTREAMGFSTRLIANYPLWDGITSYVNGGYIMVNKQSMNLSNRITWGLGISWSVRNYALGIAELQSDEKIEKNFGMGAYVGIKIFIQKHIQASAGLQANFRNRGLFAGIVAGLAFSSEAMCVMPQERSKRRTPVIPKLEDLMPPDTSFSGLDNSQWPDTIDESVKTFSEAASFQGVVMKRNVSNASDAIVISSGADAENSSFDHLQTKLYVDWQYNRTVIFVKLMQSMK